MTEDGLLKTYEIYYSRIEFIIGIHQKRISFFWSIISAIIGAVGIGLFNIKTNNQYLLLAIGPCLVFFISYMAKVILHKDKEALLHNIATVAKIEDILGLTDKDIKPNSYWVNDAVISESYIEYRKKFNTSEEFISSTLKSKGIHNTYLNIFLFLQIASVISFISLIVSYFIL